MPDASFGAAEESIPPWLKFSGLALWRLPAWYRKAAHAGTRAPSYERQVLPNELAPANEVLKATMHFVRARDDEQPRRVAVEAMDDAGPPGLLAAGDARPE